MAIWYENCLKEAESLANKARREGCWFVSDRGVWITPEQFIGEAIHNSQQWGEKDRRVISSYRICDPRESIKSKIQHIAAANYDLQKFTEKVFEYFNLHSKELQK